MEEKNKLFEDSKWKKILLAHWDCENKFDNASTKWYSPLKNFFEEVITFSPKDNYFLYGKKTMNKNLLKLIERERPDVIFFLLIYDEFDPIIFIKIREKFPNIKLVSVNSDDSWRFHDFDQYYSLFFDYILSASIPALNFYKKYKIKNVLFQCGVNLEHFKKINVKKKYDVTFIGRPGKDRVEQLEFLIKNGIRLKIWGVGWGKYCSLKENYQGVISSEDWPMIVNQSKINLSFSKDGVGNPQFKGRPLEVAACGSFCLVEYCKDYYKLFEKQELVMFNGQEDLLKKIHQYLANEKRREEIAKNTYKKILNKYNINREYSELFNKLTLTEKEKINYPSLKKVLYLQKKDFKDTRILNRKIKDYEYICFKSNCSKRHPLKEFLQIHSLNDKKKEISCCDYYVNSPVLENYLLFKSKKSFDELGKKANKFIIPEQLMVKKIYLKKNIKSFVELLNEDKINIINREITSFISIPLIKTKKIKIGKQDQMEKSFQMKFLDHLGSLYLRRKLPLKYLTYLLIKILRGNLFIAKVLLKTLINKEKINKIKQLKKVQNDKKENLP